MLMKILDKYFAYAFFIALALFFLVPIFISVIKQSNPRESLRQDTAETEKRLDNNPTLRQLDEICSQIPKPDGFELVGKRTPYKTIGLQQLYSAELYMPDIEKFYRRSLASTDWHYAGEKQDYPNYHLLVNGEYKIRISSDYAGLREGWNYSFDCRHEP